MSLSFLPNRPASKKSAPVQHSTLEPRQSSPPGGASGTPLAQSSLSYLRDAEAMADQPIGADIEPSRSTDTGSTQPGATSRALEAPKFGFDRYVQEGIAKAGARIARGKGNKGAVYQSGPYKGKTEGQAIEAMRSEYAGLDPARRASYETQANGGDVMSGAESSQVQSHHAAKERALGLSPSAGSGESSGSGLDYLRPRNEREVKSGERVGTHDEAFAKPDTGSRSSLPPTIGSSDKMGEDTPGLGYLRDRSEVVQRSAAGAVAAGKAAQETRRAADEKRRASRIAKAQRDQGEMMASIGAGSGS